MSRSNSVERMAAGSTCSLIRASRVRRHCSPHLTLFGWICTLTSEVRLSPGIAGLVGLIADCLKPVSVGVGQLQ
jgi:hypothetical protein